MEEVISERRNLFTSHNNIGREKEVTSDEQIILPVGRNDGGQLHGSIRVVLS
jgi:hypothetical protein